MGNVFQQTPCLFCVQLNKALIIRTLFENVQRKKGKFTTMKIKTRVDESILRERLLELLYLSQNPLE